MQHKSGAVAVRASYGTKDTVFPYKGGVAKTHTNCSACKLMSEQQSNLAWAKHNGCNTTKPTIDKTVNATYGLTGAATKTSATMHSFQYAFPSAEHATPHFNPLCSVLLSF